MGGSPLGTPLALSVGPGSHGLLFSLCPPGGGVGWGGGSGLEQGSGASGARPPPAQGRLTPGRPTSPPVTVCPGMGLIQPGAALMWGLGGWGGASAHPILCPSRKSPALGRERGTGWAGCGRLGYSLWLPRLPAISSWGRDTVTHPPGIRTLHLLFIGTAQTTDLACPHSPRTKNPT